MESHDAGFPPLYVAIGGVNIGSRFDGEAASTRGQPLAEPDGEERPPFLSFYVVENRRPLSLHVQGRRAE